MDRTRVAEECVQIEKAGGCVLDYLKALGCISPWGTWFRMQKEQLGRKEWQIKDGKGDEDMRKITLEQKKKAVEIALGGGNPLPFLKQCGSDSPERLWYVIKQNVKKVDPDTFAKIPARLNPSVKATETDEEKPKGWPDGFVPYERKRAPKRAEKKPEIVLTIDHEELSRTEEPEEEENVMEKPENGEQEKTEITKPVNYGGFEVMAVKSPATGFRFESDNRYGMMTWRTISGDEVSMTAEEWHKMASELPQVLEIFGI